MLDLESEAKRGPGSIPTGDNSLSLDVFYIVKPLMPILALLPILSICEKLELNYLPDPFLRENSNVLHLALNGWMISFYVKQWTLSIARMKFIFDSYK